MLNLGGWLIEAALDQRSATIRTQATAYRQAGMMAQEMEALGGLDLALAHQSMVMSDVRHYGIPAENALAAFAYGFETRVRATSSLAQQLTERQQVLGEGGTFVGNFAALWRAGGR